MSLETYDKLLKSLEDIYDEDGVGLENSSFMIPKVSNSRFEAQTIQDIIESNYNLQQILIHKSESYTKKDISDFLQSLVHMITASNGHPHQQIYIDNIIINRQCAFLGNSPTDIGCKIEDPSVRLFHYIDYLSQTILIFFQQLQTKNPELLASIDELENVELLAKVLEFVFYFFGSKFKGEMYRTLGNFIHTLHEIIPETLHILCHDNGYGWGRYIFFKSCNNKRTHGKIYIGCTAGLEFNSVNANSNTIYKSAGPICGGKRKRTYRRRASYRRTTRKQ